MLTRIRGARIVDPALGRLSGRVSDLWFRDDRIVAGPVAGDHAGASAGAEAQADFDFDATGCVVMAGGIDLHTHIGGGKVTLARMLLRDQMPPWREAMRHGETDEADAAIDVINRRLPADCQFLPAAGVTAARYLDMGYTTCLEPAVIPCNARSAHAEMADVVGIDTGGYCLLGNDDVLLQLIADGVDQNVINAYVAWMVTATRCIAVKVVNPGGISAFKFNERAFDVDTPHPRYGVTAGQVIRTLCRSVFEIGLAHPLHVHCSNLGVPGNIASTLATIRAADGYPIHLTHVQFHSYGNDGPYRFSSAASQLAEAMRAHPNVTCDVGQIQFGQTVTISADAMHQYDNTKLAKPRKSILLDIECEAGCGVVPFRYRRREFVHSLQWAIGLELFLMVEDPSRIFLTTDHPNGGPFTAYPHLLRLLSDRSFRETALAEIHPEAAAASSLAGIDREYSLDEIAIMTRHAPARILGLGDRGCLSPGKLADVVVYECHNDVERMFARPKMVFKAGQLIRQDGRVIPRNQPRPDEILAADCGRFGVDPDPKLISDFRARYARVGTFAIDRLKIGRSEIEDVIGGRLTDTGMREKGDGAKTR